MLIPVSTDIVLVDFANGPAIRSSPEIIVHLLPYAIVLSALVVHKILALLEMKNPAMLSGILYEFDSLSHA